MAQNHRLVAHRSTPPAQVSAVEVELVGFAPYEDMMFRFSVRDGQGVVLPERVSPVRTDGLWRTTCFEIFLKSADGTSYTEFNASPSTQWAAYSFDDYRENMRDQPMSIAPHIERVGDEPLCFDVDINLSDLRPGSLKLALSAVIEETDGTKSYWALRHPPGPPDFHHPDCFALQLPPAR